MRKILLAIMFAAITMFANAQCTTNNATGCKCKDTTQTDCDLLPDIQIGHPPFYVYNDDFGIKEFSQTGNGADNGKLYVTVSTPNTGHGPLELLTTDTFVCGIDTFYGTPPSICPDLVTYPKILVNQHIYHRNANGTMGSYYRAAGSMTYHPGHNHMHVDNWGNYTLRSRNPLDPNPLHWPIIGSGTKLAFCVEDYGTCPGYPGHCLDSAGNALNNSSQFPNYGLGGGNYGCSAIVQGISSGYVDIYWTTLAGMYIDIPPNICNGDYYIVCEVDPNQNFIEEDETNNVYAAPFTLTKQLPNPLIAPVNVSISNSTANLCQGESVTLTAQINMPNATFLWNTGDTTISTSVDSPGVYTVDITNQCGSGTSIPVQVHVFNPPASPIGTNDTIPTPGIAIIHAFSSFPVSWYDQPVGGSVLLTGNTFITPSINTTTTYYANVEEVHSGAHFQIGVPDSASAGVGGYYTGDQSEIFDCYNPFKLHSVKVYSPAGNNFNIELRDSSGVLLQSVPVVVNQGMNVVVIDLNITPGIGYRLTRNAGDLYRSNPGTNVGYPFNIPNYGSITGSTAGEGYFYFFYDWDIRLPDHSCTSSRTPVIAVVSNPNAIADVSVLSSLTIYPNPAKNLVNISFRADDSEAQMELIDALGRIVFQKEVHSNSGRVDAALDVALLSRGSYNIHILSSGKNFYKRLMLD